MPCDQGILLLFNIALIFLTGLSQLAKLFTFGKRNFSSKHPSPFREDFIRYIKNNLKKKKMKLRRFNEIQKLSKALHALI
jgi:hypothetical protein